MKADFDHSKQMPKKNRTTFFSNISLMSLHKYININVNLVTS